MLKTFTFFVARDGSSFVEDVDASDEIAACATAVERINALWRTHYADWDELGSDSDACTLEEHPVVMAQRIRLDTMQRYRELADEARALLNAFGGDTPDWLREQAGRVEALLDRLEQDDPGDRTIREIARPTERPDIDRFINHYLCTSCGNEWQDQWSCACDDKCGKCGTAMTPFESEDTHAPTGDA